MDEARKRFAMALSIHREGGDRREEGMLFGSLGSLEHEQGHVDEAREADERALSIHREAGDRDQLAYDASPTARSG